MENNIIVYEAPKAELSTRRNNYELRIGDFSTTLKRGVDFGKVPKAKTPSLWKSGAEKVLMGYNLAYDTEITDSYKDYNKGFFYYEIKATAYYDGKVVRTGVGCANTNERSFGVAGAFDSANSALKKAKNGLWLIWHSQSRDFLTHLRKTLKMKATKKGQRKFCPTMTR